MIKYISAIICPYRIVPYEEHFENYHSNLLKFYRLYQNGDRDIVDYKTETRKIKFYGKVYEIPVPIIELKKGETYTIYPNEDFKIYIHSSVPNNPVSNEKIAAEITFEVLSELQTYKFTYDVNNNYKSEEGFYEIEII